MCRCRPTSSTATRPRMRALPDRLRQATRARWRRRPAALHFDEALLDAARCARRPARQRHAARRRRHLPAGQDREHRRAQHAQRVVRRVRRRRRRRSRSARERGGRDRRRRHDHRAHAGILGRAPARPAATPASSSRPASSSAWSTCLLTNFHLPKLDAADAGERVCRLRSRSCDLYRHAIAQRYRFFSYGDAMLLARRD